MSHWVLEELTALTVTSGKGAGAVCDTTGGDSSARCFSVGLKKGFTPFQLIWFSRTPKGPLRATGNLSCSNVQPKQAMRELVVSWEKEFLTAQQHLLHGLLLVALGLLTCNSIFSLCAADSDLSLFPIAAIFMTIPSSLLDSLLSSTCQSSTLCKFTKHIPRDVTSKLQALCTGHLCGLLPPSLFLTPCANRGP